MLLEMFNNYFLNEKICNLFEDLHYVFLIYSKGYFNVRIVHFFGSDIYM